MRNSSFWSIAVGSGILMLQLHGFDEAVGACMLQSRRADGFDRHRIGAAAAGVAVPHKRGWLLIPAFAVCSNQLPISAGLCGC